MAEFHFYGTKDDSIELLQMLFDCCEVKCAPCLEFHDRKPPLYSKITDDLLEAIDINSMTYLTRPFSRHPLYVEKITGGKCSGMFNIDPIRGGPVIAFDLPIHKKLDRKIWHLLPGSVAYDRLYWNNSLTVSYPAPEELVKSYRQIVKLIKKQFTRNTVVHKDPIGHRANKLLEDDEALILDNGKWWDGRGKMVKSNMRLD